MTNVADAHSDRVSNSASNSEQHDVPTAAIDSTVTIVSGSTVSLTTSRGEIVPNAILGAFDRDERFISALGIQVDGATPTILDSRRISANRDRVVLIGALDKYSNGSVLIVRERSVTHAEVHESIEVHSLQGARTVLIEVSVQADGASILGLKSGKAPPAPLPWVLSADTAVGASTLATASAAELTHLAATGSPELLANADHLSIRWKADVEHNVAWSASWTATCLGRREVASQFAFPTVSVSSTDHRWAPALSSACDDLAALIVDDDQHRFIAAGAPWYLAIFGRDSLLTAWQTLPLGTDLALDVLDTLAHYQGTSYDDRRREAPGKILHERRIGTKQVFSMQPGETYFGSVDASPLFVMLLAEAYRWGAPVDRVKALLPAARAVMQWCRTDGTGSGPTPGSPFLWYRSDARGLSNQGWKDSGDCIVHADGTFAQGPIALCEVQAYFYEAMVGMARLEADLGDPEAAVELTATAEHLQREFEAAFWSPSTHLLALALDGHHAPLLVATSNMGQCLWSGILRPELAQIVADRVMAPDLFSTWGTRTLGSNERAYNPLGYHLGSVWPHDTAFIAAGMARHGFREYVRALSNAILDAAEGFDWRLPELYGGLETGPSELTGSPSSTGARSGPIPYPASCSPQAWSAGAPLLLLRSMLGLRPDVPSGQIETSSALAPEGRLSIDGIVIGATTYRIDVTGATVNLTAQ
jgi:glycogen debranching enzyme